METIEERVRGYNQDAASGLDIERQKFAHTGDALKYAVYCDALGIEPEAQFINLYNRGITESSISSNKEKVEKMQFHLDKLLYVTAHNDKDITSLLTEKVPADEYKENISPTLNKESQDKKYARSPKGSKKILNKRQKKFLENSVNYSINPLDSKQLNDKKREITAYHYIFRQGQKRDLEITGQDVGKLYNHLREGYVKRLEYHEPNNPLVNKIYDLIGRPEEKK